MSGPLYVRASARVACLATLLAFSVTTARAHVGEHPSVHDTVSGALTRMTRER